MRETSPPLGLDAWTFHPVASRCSVYGVTGRSPQVSNGKLSCLTLFHLIRDIWQQLVFCPLAACTQNAGTRYNHGIEELPFVPQGHITHLRYNAPGLFYLAAVGGQQPAICLGCCRSEVCPRNGMRLSILWSSVIAFCMKSVGSVDSSLSCRPTTLLGNLDHHHHHFIFSRASDLYLCLYNQLFALFHYVFKFLTL